MAHFLDASQLAEACNALGLEDEEAALLAAADRAGQAIAATLDIEVTIPASNEPGFGGLCVGFGPKKDGDPCPDEIISYDTSSEWAENTE